MQWDSPLVAGPLDRDWVSSRAGATAGRGYHYQDLVGAWMALRVLTGEVGGTQLIVEGFDDFTCEDPVAGDQQVQVKSRQSRVGDFRVADAARFLVDAWDRHRNRAGAAGITVTVVLERAVAGHGPAEWARPMLDDPGLAGVAAAARTVAAGRGWADVETADWLGRSSVVVLPQNVLLAECAGLVAGRTGLPVGAAIPVVQAVRAAVADASDENAAVADWAGRAGLTRGALERVVVEAAGLVDRESLLEAVRTGICEPVDFDSPLPDAGFYTGTAVQPGHVAAGLVVPRPAETEQVLAGLRAGRPVLVAGPSGTGKSAVTWLAAWVARHAVWYRVNRLRAADVEPLIRLARAVGAGRYGPVGLVVDGVGTGALTAWDELYRRVAGTPGVLLVGSVREEDTLLLETFADAVLVRPRLDAALAARIHAALHASGATDQTHWQEALRQSNGLTMEFTHLLTQGARLGQVVGEQVRARVRDPGRGAELEVLALVSAGHRWGARLPVDALPVATATPAADLRRALARLVEEHLVHVDRGLVDGLHPLRSVAICDAVHNTPPPTLAATVPQVLRHLPVDQAEGFIGRAVADQPDLGLAVVDTLTSLLGVEGAGGARLAAAALSGLRLADFTAAARGWVEVLRRHRVAVPLQPLAIDLAMIDTDLFDGLDPPLRAAVTEIRAGRDDRTSTLRDQLLVSLPSGELARLVAGADSLDEVLAVLAPLASSGVDLLPDGPGLAGLLDAVPLSDVGQVVDAAAAVSPATGAAVLAAAGGQQRLIERLLADHPWVLDLQVVDEVDDRVLRGRLLYISDRVTPDPERAAKAFAALGLQCLDADRADLETVVAGGGPLAVDEWRLADSGLLRRYAVGPSAIAWNQARGRFARSLVSAPSTTHHLTAGHSALSQAERFLADLVDAWLTERLAGRQLLRLEWRRRELVAAADTLAPRRADTADVDEPARNEPVHGLVHGIVANLAGRLSAPAGYRGLAGFAGDTLRGYVPAAGQQPWELIGLDGPPPTLARIDTLLADLAAVLDELATDEDAATAVGMAVASAGTGAALGAAAAEAGRRAECRYRAAVAAVIQDAAGQGVPLQVLSRPEPAPPAGLRPAAHTAFLVDVETTPLSAAVAVLPELLDRHPLSEPTVLLVPVHRGSTLTPYIRRVRAGGSVDLAGPEVDDWAQRLPPGRELRCADAVTRAVDGLHELSSLAYLQTQRDATDPAQQAADQAVEQVLAALTVLDALPADPVIAEIILAVNDLVDQVHAEHNGQPTDLLAASLIAATLGAEDVADGSAAAAAINLTEIAVAWDLDPAKAAQLLEQLAGDDTDPGSATHTTAADRGATTDG